MKPRVIVLEGADRCGKTTLAKKIADHYHAFYWHMTCTSKLAEAMHDYQMNAIENIRTNVVEFAKTVVIDRHWPSEVVYGEVMRGRNFRESGELFHQALVDLDVIYIFCFSREALKRHAEDRDPTHPYTDEQYNRIYNGYADLYAQLQEKYPNRVIGYHLEDVGMRPYQLKAFIHGLQNVK